MYFPYWPFKGVSPVAALLSLCVCGFMCEVCGVLMSCILSAMVCLLLVTLEGNVQ